MKLTNITYITWSWQNVCNISSHVHESHKSLNLIDELTNKLKLQSKEDFNLAKSYITCEISAYNSHIIGATGSIDEESNITSSWRDSCLDIK